MVNQRLVERHETVTSTGYVSVQQVENTRSSPAAVPLPIDKGKDRELQDTADSMARVPSGPPRETDFQGASMIDSNGRKIPITEAMVQEALTRLSRTASGLELQWL